MKSLFAAAVLSAYFFAAVWGGSGLPDAGIQPSLPGGLPSVGTPAPEEPSPAPAPEQTPSTPIDPTQLRLDLPEEYSIQYTVQEEYIFSRSYTQTMTRCSEGIYLQLGDSGERYVLERLDSGKYLQYRYDPIQGTYRALTLTPELQRQIDAGLVDLDRIALDAVTAESFAARITSNFDCYRVFARRLVYVDEGEVAGRSCCHFSACFDESWGEQNVQVWIEPETGLCMKAEYQFQTPSGHVGTRKIECVFIETENIALPDYK